jgi:alpha-tubulin suppressor-like RCC1 family protein
MLQLSQVQRHNNKRGKSLFIVCILFLESGDLFTWGLNGSSGRLGLGHHQHEYVAKQVDMENNTVVDVALGTNHALALCV